jgi:eukaryotic-like serine/threonine-protein kinase
MDAIAQLKTALAGRYAVDREIGRGGMATVFLARDVRHNRNVALKVLNPELGAVLGTERFLSEIQVTANLQHPNLLPLFDSGEADGLLFYVMPYVEGESLRAKLQREKQLPIDESIHIATAVLSALDYAHRHGVIHRDLKPENILMHEGQPLVADFGIALAVSNAGGNRITQTGLSLGTPQYMSPEQATGDREVDGRTDVYSLGAVLYEMLSGEPPHDGKTSQAIIAKVLTDKPRSLRLSRDTVPPHVEAATERALAKLPADRFHSAHEFAGALLGRGVVVPTGTQTPATILSSSGSVTRPIAQRLLGMLPWAAAAVGLSLAAIAWLTRQPREETVLRYEIPLPRTNIMALGIGNPLTVSPGGRHVAYAGLGEDGVRKILVKGANELHPREINGSVSGRNPFFSPDGKWIVYYAASQLRKASVAGGTSALLSEAPGAGRGSWSRSGYIIMSSAGRLARMPANGGRFEPFTRIDSTNGETSQLAPIALDDGETVLYTSFAMGGAAAARIGLASLRDGSTTILPVAGSYALGVIADFLVYVTSTGIVMAVPIDLRKREVRGAPVPVIDQVATESSGDAFAHLTHDGVLMMFSGTNRRRLALAEAGVLPKVVIADAQNYQWPRLSPDGRRIAMTLANAGRSDIWIYDLPSGPLTRLTTQGTLNDRPEWMPDGRAVLFRSNRGALNALWLQPVDGAGDARQFFAMSNSKVDEGVVSNDGRYLLFQRDSTGVGDLWYATLTGDTIARPIETTPVAEISGRFSPDGKWIAYSSSESGAAQVYVRPFPSLSVRYQVSLDGGGTPVWSRDGRFIFYTSGRRVMRASIVTQPSFIVTNRTLALDRLFTFNGVHADFDVMPDGKTLLGLQPADEDAQLIVVHNWQAELFARVRGTNR